MVGVSALAYIRLSALRAHTLGPVTVTLSLPPTHATAAMTTSFRCSHSQMPQKPTMPARAQVFRDGASMLGGLMFTWLGGTSFDRSVKFWRLFADAINDAGLTLEMLSPLCGQYFILVACACVRACAYAMHFDAG